MPKINLKEKSPEFKDPAKPHSRSHACDMPYCPSEGTFRAPKDRSLSDHYHFCQDHITEYNKAWNFFEGMNQREVEEQILKSMFGDRPTWRSDVDGMGEESIRRQAYEFHGMGGTDNKSSRAWEEYQERGNSFESQTQEHEAMAIFGLEPPVNLDDIKARYKELAKKYHPDINQDNPNAEEQLKRVNMSYTVLKLAFQKFDQMETE